MIIRDKSHPKVIDFCQACLISDPIIYKTKAGFTKHAKYNKIHKPLASELRNISGSVVSIETDLYTLGCIMNNVTSRINNEPLQELSQTMMSEKTENLPLLADVLYKIERIMDFYL